MNITHGNPPTLRETQRRMQALILAGGDGDAAMIESLLVAPPAGTAHQRLCAYAHGFPARIAEALGDSFPALAHIVGLRAFAALAQRFGTAIPLHSHSLDATGADLENFLRADELSGGLPFLPDLARLEWSVARAFHAADEAPLQASVLAGWTLADWERAVLRLQPWVAVVSSEWPIRELWECRDTPIDAIDIDLSDRPDYVLVRRTGFAVVCESISAAEAAALRDLSAGRRLGDVLAGVAEGVGGADAVTGLFAHWMSLRLITGAVAAD